MKETITYATWIEIVADIKDGEDLLYYINKYLIDIDGTIYKIYIMPNNFGFYLHLNEPIKISIDSIRKAARRDRLIDDILND